MKTRLGGIPACLWCICAYGALMPLSGIRWRVARDEGASHLSLSANGTRPRLGPRWPRRRSSSVQSHRRSALIGERWEGGHSLKAVILHIRPVLLRYRWCHVMMSCTCSPSLPLKDGAGCLDICLSAFNSSRVTRPPLLLSKQTNKNKHLLVKAKWADVMGWLLLKTLSWLLWIEVFMVLCSPWNLIKTPWAGFQDRLSAFLDLIVFQWRVTPDRVM